jgi:hypothetical protein
MPFSESSGTPPQPSFEEYAERLGFKQLAEFEPILAECSKFYENKAVDLVAANMKLDEYFRSAYEIINQNIDENIEGGAAKKARIVAGLYFFVADYAKQFGDEDYCSHTLDRLQAYVDCSDELESEYRPIAEHLSPEDTRIVNDGLSRR